MARITVEDCLTKENNRFALVQLASKRTKQLLQGSKPLIEENRNNKAVVLALREIAGGKVRFMTEEEARIAKEQAELEASRVAEQALSAPQPEPQNGSTAELTEDSIFAKPPADEPITDDPIADDEDEDEGLGDEDDEDEGEDSEGKDGEGGNEPSGENGPAGEPAA